MCLPVFHAVELLNRAVLAQHLEKRLRLFLGAVANVNLIGLADARLLLDELLQASRKLGHVTGRARLEYGLFRLVHQATHVRSRAEHLGLLAARAQTLTAERRRRERACWRVRSF